MHGEFFIQLFLILCCARFFGECVAKFHIPSVIGELFAGIVLGPSVFNLIQPNETIQLLAEIGVVLLLFEVGLESDITKLLESGFKAGASALAGVIAPFVLGYALCVYVFHMPLLPSLFIGATLTATSIGITLRVLSDLKRQSSRETHIVLGAAVIDDIIGIILLAVLYEFASVGKAEWMGVIEVLFFILSFLLIAPFVASILARIIKYHGENTDIPGLLPTSIVCLILLFAFLARHFGAPELLGGFAAGIALSPKFFSFLPQKLQIGTSFSTQVEHQMKPITHIFTPIFFVTIGLSMNLRTIDWNNSFVWQLSALLLAVAIIGKLCSGFVLVKENTFIKWAVGIAMIPRGEVGLIFADVGKTSNVFTNEIYTVAILVIAVTTICTPLVMRAFYAKASE